MLGQINYTGSIKPGNMYRLSDQSEISLPFRLAEAEVGYSKGDFEIKTNSIFLLIRHPKTQHKI